MKRAIAVLLAMLTAPTIIMAGCGSDAGETNTATEYVNDDLLADAENSDAANSSSIIVVDDLFQPIMEEAGNSASTSTVNKDAASEASTEKEAQETHVEMVFIGDSQMANGRDDDTDLATLVSKRVPNSRAYNLGIGGTTAAVEMSTTNLGLDDWTSLSFLGIVHCLSGKVDRNRVLQDYPKVLENMNKIDPKNVDYYFIEYGANDFFQKIPLDKNQYDGDIEHTYYGALIAGMEELKKISPGAKIIFMTPFYGVYYDSDKKYIGDSYVVSNGYGTLADYARKNKNVTEDEKLIDFDCMFISTCDLYLDKTEQYLMDGTHLTLKGRQVFSRLLAHLPNFYEKNEPYAYLKEDYINIDTFDPEEYFVYPVEKMQKYYPEAYQKLLDGEYSLALTNGALEPTEEAEENNEENNESNN